MYISLHINKYTNVHTLFCKVFMFVSYSFMFIHSCNSTAQKDRVTGEKGPVTEHELGAYALSWSFSHVSHRSQSRSFVPNRSLALVTGVSLSSGRLRPAPRGYSYSYSFSCSFSIVSGRNAVYCTIPVAWKGRSWCTRLYLGVGIVRECREWVPFIEQALCEYIIYYIYVLCDPVHLCVRD